MTIQEFVQTLKKHQVFSEFFGRIWQQRPLDINEEEAIDWFADELVQRGYISEDTMDLILDELDKTSKISGNEVQRAEKVATQKQEKFAHYTIIKELGRGGMGVVYKVFDPILNREVALKMVLEYKSNKSAIRRFLVEAKTMAQLRHPNIVQIFEIGREGDLDYFTMEYIRGQALSEIIAQQNIPPRMALEIVYAIALALDQVHSSGIIHRDIKPDNIMIENKEPKLMDFGLAKTAKSFTTHSGVVLGTPAYMSPEQAEGKIRVIDARSDIYSLGAILYEMITSRGPFEGENVAQIIAQISNKEPIAPRKLNIDIHPDIQTICLKCLEKNPHQRYQNANELAQDICRFLENRVILAKPAGIWRKTSKWIQRNRLFSSATVVFAITVLTVSLWLGSSLQKEQQEKEDAIKNNKIRLAKVALAKVKEASDERDWQKCGVLCGAGLQLIQGLNKKDIASLKTELDQYFRVALEQHGLLWQYHFPKNLKIQSVQFAKNNFITLTSDKVIRLWNIQTKKAQVIDVENKDLITSVALHPKQTGIAIGKKDGTIQLWDFRRNRIIQTFREHSSEVTKLQFGLYGKILASASRNKVVVIDSIAQKSIAINVSLPPRYLCLSDFGDKAAVGFNRSVWLFNTLDGKLLKEIQTDPGLCAISLSPSSNYLFCGYENSIIHVWTIASNPQIINVYKDHHSTISNIYSVGFFNLSTSEDGDIKIWEGRTTKTVRSIVAHQQTISTIDIQRQKLLLLSGAGNVLRLWKVSEIGAEIIRTPYNFFDTSYFPKEKSGKVFSQNYYFEGELLASGSNQGANLVHYAGRKLDFQGRFSGWNYRGYPKSVYAVDISRDGEIFVGACEDGNIRLWDRNLKPMVGIRGHQKAISALEIFSDGVILASASTDKSVVLWDIRKRQKIHSLLFDTEIYSLTFHPENKILTVGGGNGVIELWDIEQKKLICKLTQHSDKITALRFYKGGTRFMSASWDNTVKFWDFKAQRLVFSLDCREKISAADITADGRYLIAGGLTNFTTKIWDLTINRVVYDSIFHYGESINTIKISPSGNKFVSCGDNLGVFPLTWLIVVPKEPIAQWSKQFKFSPPQMTKSSFDVREDVPGWFIEQVLKTQPRKLSELLFGAKATDKFFIKPLATDIYLAK